MGLSTYFQLVTKQCNRGARLSRALTPNIDRALAAEVEPL